ncbi:alpha-L-rhamnosidase [uncultured Victivallis sp.]|uniref:alpha-L-rhamnosidase n=1 Tax=uncultured Victivallis sp. TaxID=354118 RepID=UPI00258CA2F7|nr:alpha-L-rhamnosidase [uncultured Victivallis sp.]
MSILAVTGVQVNDRDCTGELLFVASPQVEFSWRIETDSPGSRQCGYQIVATDADGRLLWDSGRVAGNACRGVPWRGAGLKAGDRVSFRIRVFDRTGNPSPFSVENAFAVALQSPADWNGARWVRFAGNRCAAAAPAPHFRREFTVGDGLRRAVLSITARGVFEPSLDGTRIGGDLLAPGWTDFRKQIQFLSYDLSDRLPPGRHALGVILAEGWCCGNLTVLRMRNVYHPHPELLAHLELVYRDGRRESVVTDSGWKTATGPILGSDLYDGEDYDARQEMPGWNTPGFDDGAWEAARESGGVAETPRLVQKSAPPVRYMRELKPVRLLRPKKDVCIWDFGQNFSGTFRVRPRGIPGRRYTFATAEILEPDGSLYTLNYRGARSQDSYICAGPVEQAAEYVPKFTFHGFRYLQIDGWQFDRIPPEELDVTALVMYSAMPDRCRFSCGDSGVNRLWLNALWGQRSNFLEIPTDCPQRDERLGWTGDAQIFAPAAMLNMDCLAFFRKYLRDIRDGFTPEGAAPSIAPAVLHINDGAAGWGDAVTLLPCALYRHYGSTAVLTENYEAMKSALNYQLSRSEEFIIGGEGQFGDWLAPEATPPELVATAYFAHCAETVAEAAGILRIPGDRDHFLKLAENAGRAFRQKFTDGAGLVRPATQTALVLALAFGLVAPGTVSENLDLLEQRIRGNGTKLSTGFLGTTLILPTLARFGRTLCACDLLLQEECPSWLFQVRQGATTFWERWDGFSQEKGFGDVSMNSFNHYAYGAVSEFLVSWLAGIHYRHDGLVFEIIPDRRFSPVKAVFDSPFGRIASSWSLTPGGGLHWEAEVPPGLPASARLPGGRELPLAPGRHTLS